MEQCPWKGNSEELISNCSVNISFLFTKGNADYVGTNAGALAVMVGGNTIISGISYQFISLMES